MSSKAEPLEAQAEIRRYEIQYPVSAYTFPTEARIHQVRFDDEYIHLELTDGRVLSIPLWWMPTLYNALPAEREKYEISRSRTMLIWNPSKCAINDELRLSDYLSTGEDSRDDIQPGANPGAWESDG